MDTTVRHTYCSGMQMKKNNVCVIYAANLARAMVNSSRCLWWGEKQSSIGGDVRSVEIHTDFLAGNGFWKGK